MVSSGGLVAEVLSDTVVGLLEEAMVEGCSVDGAVVAGCVGAGGHAADNMKLRIGMLIGRERMCITPSLAGMSAVTILLPPTIVSLPLTVTGTKQNFSFPMQRILVLFFNLIVELYLVPDTM